VCQENDRILPNSEVRSADDWKKEDHFTTIVMSVSGLRRGSETPHRRSKFGPEEDTLLSELVYTHGTDAWLEVSRSMPGRNRRQCRDRWVNFRSPDITKDPWTEAEENLLSQMCREFGTSWKRIASYFQRRSEVSVKSHWHVMRRRTEREIIRGAHIRLFGHILPPPQEPRLGQEPMVQCDRMNCDDDSDAWLDW
jgi:hypothetical protein